MELPDVMTPKRLSEATGIPRRTIYQWVQNGTLPSFTFGRNKYIRRDALPAGMLTPEEAVSSGVCREQVKAELEAMQNRIETLLKGL